MNHPHGSDGSGDEREDSANSGRDRKHYYRHTAEQIQQLEAFFKDCPHPDEDQRLQLSRDLGLEPKQVKFWFQNKRTQAKTQNERADNNVLRTENERFQIENLAMREALRNAICPKCEGSFSGGDEARLRNLQILRAENAWLRQERERLSKLFSGLDTKPGIFESNFSQGFRPHTNLPEAFSSQGLGLGLGGFLINPFGLQHVTGTSSMNPLSLSPFNFPGIPEMEKTVMVETAITAMDELLELLRAYEPLWITYSIDGRYFLHQETYNKLFPKIISYFSGSQEYWIESSKESGNVSMSATHLIDIFRDPKKWMEFFPTIVSKARNIEALDTGNRGGSLYLMHEKLHVLSPLVAPREFTYLRYIRQLDSTMWAIVNVSYDYFKGLDDPSFARTWRLPSGCLIQAMPDEKANVTWIEHVHVDDKSLTHDLYKNIVRDSQAYGAKRWLVTLERMCERFEFSMGSRITPGHELEGVIGAPEGRRNLIKLSHKMIKNFYEVLSVPEKLDLPQLSELTNNGFRVSVRRSDATLQPNGVIVCVATSLRLPTSFQNLFNFFNDENERAQWDIMSDVNPIHKIANISTGTHPGNSVSLMQPSNPRENNNILILQESSIDSLGAFLIYAPVDLSAVASIINSQEDSTNMYVLPSGFIISSDHSGGVDGGIGASSSSGGGRPGSSLLTVMFQIVVSSDIFSEQQNVDSVATVHALVTSTIHKIRLAIASRF